MHCARVFPYFGRVGMVGAYQAFHHMGAGTQGWRHITQRSTTTQSANNAKAIPATLNIELNLPRSIQSGRRGRSVVILSYLNHRRQTAAAAPRLRRARNFASHPRRCVRSLCCEVVMAAGDIRRHQPLSGFATKYVRRGGVGAGFIFNRRRAPGGPPQCEHGGARDAYSCLHRRMISSATPDRSGATISGGGTAVPPAVSGIPD